MREYKVVKGAYGHRVIAIDNGPVRWGRWVVTGYTTEVNANRIARLFRASRPDLARLACAKLGVASLDYQF